MASLLDNLTTVNNIKLQIKEILNTSSYVFSEYPSLIEEAIAAGGGLTWADVAAAGYVLPVGTYNITADGLYDISNYAYTYVDTGSVPTIDEAFILYMDPELGDYVYDSMSWAYSPTLGSYAYQYGVPTGALRWNFSIYKSGSSTEQLGSDGLNAGFAYDITNYEGYNNSLNLASMSTTGELLTCNQSANNGKIYFEYGANKAWWETDSAPTPPLNTGFYFEEENGLYEYLFMDDLQVSGRYILEPHATGITGWINHYTNGVVDYTLRGELNSNTNTDNSNSVNPIVIGSDGALYMGNITLGSHAGDIILEEVIEGEIYNIYDNDVD